MPRAQTCQVCLLGTTDVNTSTCWVEDYDLPAATETDDYQASGAAGQDPYDYMGELYNDAPFSITWVVKGSTPADLAANINALQRLLFHGQKITWRDGGMDQTMYTWLRITHPLQIDYHGKWARCKASGTREYDWWGTQRDDDPVAVTDGMGYIDVADPGGELPAATVIRSTWDQATALIAVGAIPDPQTGLNVVHEYTGTANALARDGAVATLAMTTALQTIGTPPTLDKEVHHGRWVVMARVTSDAATAGNTKYAGISTISGSGMSSSQAVIGPERAGTVISSAGLEVVVLGQFELPAASVAEIDATGWSDEAASEQETGYDTTKVSAGGTWYGETIELGLGERFRGFMLYPTAGAGTMKACLYAVGATDQPVGTPLQSVTFTPSAGADQRVDFDYVATAAGNYCVMLVPVDASSSLTMRANTAGTYAPGTARVVSKYTGWDYDTDLGSTGSLHVGLTIAVAGDLYFKAYTQSLREYSATIGVQAKCSESSKTAQLDVVCLVPEPCVLVSGAFGAGEGIMVNNLRGSAAHRNVFLCTDTGGAGASVIDSATRYGVLMLKPGVTNRVVVCAYTPTGAVPGDGEVVVTTIQRFLSRSRAA